jgi:hypothetical protein
MGTNIANDHGDFATLPEDIDPEPANAMDWNGKIHFQILFKFSYLLLIH